MNRGTESRKPARFSSQSRPIDVTLDDEREFAQAIATYKQMSGRQFPTCSELLEVLQSLGYAKRIWKPVETWSPIASRLPGGEIPCRDTSGVLGWYSSVETPVGY